MDTLSGYPDAIGAHKLSVFPHAGPSSYTQLTTAPVAGGNVVQAVEAGMRFFDVVLGGVTDSGLYRVEAVLPVGHASDDRQAAPTTTVRLRWTVISTGAEVAGGFDLDAEIVRLTAIGPK